MTSLLNIPEQLTPSKIVFPQGWQIIVTADRFSIVRPDGEEALGLPAETKYE